MNEEIKAMRAIAKALDGLPDDAARQRVLQWVLGATGHPAETYRYGKED